MAKLAELALLLSILALISGGVQLIGGMGQVTSGWICIVSGVLLFCFFLYEKIVQKNRKGSPDLPNTPREVFKIFGLKKIEQGEKLFHSNLEDKLTRRLPQPNPPIQHPDGSILPDGGMDPSQIRDFNRCYAEWKFEVHKGFANAFSFYEHPAFSDPSIGATHLIYGNGRATLEKEIKILKEIEKKVKTDWFKDGFKPDLLKEYEELECDEFKTPNVIQTDEKLVTVINSIIRDRLHGAINQVDRMKKPYKEGDHIYDRLVDIQDNLTNIWKDMGGK